MLRPCTPKNAGYDPCGWIASRGDQVSFQSCACNEKIIFQTNAFDSEHILPNLHELALQRRLRLDPRLLLPALRVGQSPQIELAVACNWQLAEKDKRHWNHIFWKALVSVLTSSSGLTSSVTK
jgi:hypothetical protein